METKREGKVGVVGVSKAGFSAPLEAEERALLRSTLRGEARLGSTEIEDSTEEHERASTILDYDRVGACTDKNHKRRNPLTNGRKKEGTESLYHNPETNTKTRFLIQIPKPRIISRNNEPPL